MWRDGAWTFHDAQAGWRVFNLADNTLYALDAAFSWTAIGGLPASDAEIQNAALIGLGTTAPIHSPQS